MQSTRQVGVEGAGEKGNEEVRERSVEAAAALQAHRITKARRNQKDVRTGIVVAYAAQHRRKTRRERENRSLQGRNAVAAMCRCRSHSFHRQQEPRSTLSPAFTNMQRRLFHAFHRLHHPNSRLHAEDHIAAMPPLVHHTGANAVLQADTHATHAIDSRY